MRKLSNWVATVGAVAALAVAAAPALAGDEKAESAESSDYHCTDDIHDCLAWYAGFMRRGWIGLLVETQGPTKGMVVTKVYGHMPASEAGFRVGDVLVVVDGFHMGDPGLRQARAEWRVGTRHTYEVMRDGQTVKITVRRAPVPDSLLYLWAGEHLMKGHLTADAHR